jgi:hypothetical protein
MHCLTSDGHVFCLLPAQILQQVTEGQHRVLSARDVKAPDGGQTREGQHDSLHASLQASKYCDSCHGMESFDVI